MATMSQSSPSDVASSLLASQLGLRFCGLEVLQELWAGYGQVCRVTAEDESGHSSTYILKLITPPPAKHNDEGHIRKIRSYHVEQYFYTQLAPFIEEKIPVAHCFASINERHDGRPSTTAMLLNDLRTKFPVAGEKRGVLNEIQVHAALDWLSSFHGFWWDFAYNRVSLMRPPLEEDDHAESRTIWLNGGYTYLATRRKEFEALKTDKSSQWREPLTSKLENGVSLAETVAAVLAPNEKSPGPTEDYQTVIHGDVKSENMFTTESGKQAVFYDFQYVGLGLGVCDLAKLFTCSVPLDMLVEDEGCVPSMVEMQVGEKNLLERYLKDLKVSSGANYEWHIFVRHWETALVDWLRFQASWGFWGNTKWLEGRVRSILRDEGWRKWLVESYRPL